MIAKTLRAAALTLFVLGMNPLHAAPAPPAADVQPPKAVPSATADLDHVVQAIQKRYAAVQRMTTQVRQVSKIQPLDRIQRRNSKLLFEKPNRLRWQYDAPDPVLYVCDGTVLWVSQPEDNLVIKLRVSDSQLQAALQFMFGLSEVQQTFDLTLDAALLPLAYRLHLVPKQTQQQYKRLTLVVDPASFEIRESFVTDPLDNVHHYIFDHPDFETPVSADQFRFTPPKGATVRDLTQEAP